MYRILCFALASANLLLFAPHAVAAQYSFVNIADSRGDFDVFDSNGQAVSDTGAVAFKDRQLGQVVGSYVGDGTFVNFLADLSPSDGFFNSGNYVINGSGVAATTEGRCCPGAGGLERLQLYEAIGTRTIASIDTSSGYLLGYAVNNSGHVAVGIENYGASQIWFSIERWFDGVSTTVVDGSEGFEGLWAPGLNELGDVAFQSYIDDGVSYYRTDGTTLTLIADSSGPLRIVAHDNGKTAINDSGAVAFWSPLDSGDEGIFVGDGGPLTTVVLSGPTTPFYTLGLGQSVAINNQGTVAFFGSLWDGRSGIFTGPDPVNDKIVADGDFLFGQLVTGLGYPHLNERGDIAFWYEVRDFNEPDGYRTGIALAVKDPALQGDFDADGDVDGRDFLAWQRNPSIGNLTDWQENYGTGLLVATNVAVPEPATLLLVMLATAGGLVSRRTGLLSSLMELPYDNYQKVVRT